MHVDLPLETTHHLLINQDRTAGAAAAAHRCAAYAAAGAAGEVVYRSKIGQHHAVYEYGISSALLRQPISDDAE